MKKISFLLLMVMMCITMQVNAQSTDGIQFCQEGSQFADAVSKAKAENKMVFLDCYTSWCGPSKMMARDIFPQKKV